MLNDSSETNMALAKEWIINEESEDGRHDQSKCIIENVYGEGYVTEYSAATDRADGRQVQRGERTDRSGNTEKARTSNSLNGSGLLRELAEKYGLLRRVKHFGYAVGTFG